jgi:hypothetical protein
MKKLYRIARRLARQPRTSAAGLAAVAGVGLAALSDPHILAEPATWIAVLTGIGLLLAADSGGPPAAPGTEAKPRKRRKVVEMPPRRELRLCA